jgi:hypothetical protein
MLPERLNRTLPLGKCSTALREDGTGEPLRGGGAMEAPVAVDDDDAGSSTRYSTRFPLAVSITLESSSLS